MAKAKEKRINAYFGKSFEDKEVWNYLLQYEDRERSYQLKHLAYMALKTLQYGTTETLKSKPATRKKKTEMTTELVEKSTVIPIMKSNDALPKENTSLTKPSVEEEEVKFTLNDLIVDGPAEDPEVRLQKSFDKFITEDEDDLLIAQQIMQQQSESAK